MTYTSLEATLHDAFWDSLGPPAEVPLIDAFLHQHPGRALEIGCGSGRLLLPLARKGHIIDGLDLSPDMLALARQNASEAGLDLELYESAQEDFDLPHRYHAITIPAFTLQLSHDPLATLRRCHHHLEPGGGLYLTTFTPWAEILGELETGVWFDDHSTSLSDGRIAVCETRMQIDVNQLQLQREHRYTIRDDSGMILERHECSQQLTWYALPHLELLLQNAGFTMSKIIADFDPEAEMDDFCSVFTVYSQKT